MPNTAPRASVPSIAVLMASPAERAARLARPASRVPFRTITVTAAARQGLAPRNLTAESLHAWLPADGTVVPVWERIGVVHSEVEYGLFHMRAVAGRIETVRADGSVVSAVPLGEGRTVRTFTRSA
jgi:hypothetical protein